MHLCLCTLSQCPSLDSHSAHVSRKCNFNPSHINAFLEARANVGSTLHVFSVDYTILQLPTDAFMSALSCQPTENFPSALAHHVEQCHRLRFWDASTTNCEALSCRKCGIMEQGMTAIRVPKHLLRKKIGRRRRGFRTRSSDLPCWHVFFVFEVVQFTFPLQVKVCAV